MQIVIVTRHIARAATYYSPVIRALTDGDTEVTLVGPAGTDASIAERRGLRTREVALRPFGQRPVALEWAVLAGDLVSMIDGDGSPRSLDVLMSFEQDLAPAVTMAARAVRARLVVLATDTEAAPSVAARVHHALEPLWSKLQAQTRGVMPKEASQRLGALLQKRARSWFDAAQVTFAEVPMTRIAREAGEGAWESLEHAANQLGSYIKAPATHYLLREEPQDWQPPAGWTDFQFGTGINVERFVAYGQGRDISTLAGRPMAVGIYADFFGEPLKRQAMVHDAQFAVKSLPADAATWITWEPSSLAPNGSLIDAQRRYLNTLDVAIVPADDLYAAMQAAAAGCVVVTEQESLAAGTFRDGESGFALPVLDQVQLTQVLRRLMDVGRRPQMQDAAQRRALRLFNADFFLRRLTRGMEANLQVEQDKAPVAERRMRRHI